MKRNIVMLAIAAAVLCTTQSLGQQQPKTAAPRKQLIVPAGYHASTAPLSPAILAGDTLYLSGSVGSDPATGQLVTGGFEPEIPRLSRTELIASWAGRAWIS